MTPILLLCTIAYVTDADSVRCATGERIRLAAVSALESDGSCNSTPHCPIMPFDQARAIAVQELQGRTITFRIVGISGKRLVGEHYGTRCNLIRSGAVVAWPSFERRYGLAGCGR